MKLKTVLRKDDFQGRAFVDHIEGSEVDHDAAAAHALMQAMREAGDGSADVAFYSDDDYQNWVYDRCDALLKQWGFDTGEAE